MKTKALLLVSLMVLGTVGFVRGDEEAADKAKAKVRQPQAPGRQAPPRGPAGRPDAASRTERPTMPDRSGMYREMLSKQSQAHRESLQELEAIKKIADEEGAVKTAEAIQALIDKKDAEFKKELEKFEAARQKRAEQLEKRLRERQPETGDAPKAPDAPDAGADEATD